MKAQGSTNKAAVTAQNDQLQSGSQDGEQSVDAQVAEAVEQSYRRKLAGGTAICQKKSVSAFKRANGKA